MKASNLSQVSSEMPMDRTVADTATRDMAKSYMGGHVASTPPTFVASTAAPDAVAPDPAANQRIVIYSAMIQIVVSNTSGTLEQIRSATQSAGGYMQEQDNVTMTVRVPAGKFDEVLNRIAQLGEVVNKQVKSDDITEEMKDLQIRLDNALRMRDRLLKLVDSANKTEDALKIEAELQRLTETIERMKGRQRFLESQAAFSTIKVVLNSPVPQEQRAGRVPFPWITALGDGLVAGHAEAQPRGDSWLNRGIRFELPKTYIRYFVDDTHTEAMSATGQLVKVQKQQNYDRGEIVFWSKLARKTLVDYRSIAITEEREIKLDTGASAVLFIGNRTVAGMQQGYLLALASNKDDVVTFEAWGPMDEFVKDRTELEKTVKTIKLKP